MATFIQFGVIYSNSPNQNAGIFVGQNSITGWDANQKFNIGHGAAFGTGNLEMYTQVYLMDGFEYIDGVMNDMDNKPSSSLMF
ncbi:hypothetical protein [Alicyclobacillus ferrooxydans]|uniref:Uncharacterized protein n=1 Tax=Alicyclobacillus ferrooxydans TaxID=471514 RepID=A0A0P9EVQ9_9BACL|nr:hypothetical protein [Alicyclobacillus ferrooxydans]KPV43089.1 hypothetical protein AN477_14240 [Alicyclobacillus ferrooxydans]